MSFADDLAAELVARIATITVANGFSTDIGAAVFDGRRKLDEEQVPCAVIVEGDDAPAGQQAGKVKHVVRYAIEGIAACDPDNPNAVGRAIVADIMRAVWGSDPTFGRRVAAAEYVGRTIAPREDGQALVSASVEFSVSYAEALAG